MADRKGNDSIGFARSDADTFSEVRYGEYKRTETSISLRHKSASCGGGSEVIIVTSHNSMHTSALTNEIAFALAATDSHDPPTVTELRGGVTWTQQ